MTAIAGSACVPEIWIMAPNGETPDGGASNSVRFQSPLNDTSKLTLVSDADVGFTPEVLDKKDMLIQVRGKKIATADFSAKLKLGGTLDSLSVPVKIKAMKKRTVKVAVHKVFGIDGSGNQTVPANFPTKAALDNYLDEVYGRQTNTFFDSTMYDEKDSAGNGIPFDRNNDGLISHNINDQEVKDLIVNPQAGEINPTANIDIWVAGGVTIADAQETYYGYKIGAGSDAKILIDGDLLKKPGTPAELELKLLYVFAHEIGHVMAGSGHADSNEHPCKSMLFWKAASPSNNVNAPLWAARDPHNFKRLKCSGDNVNFKNPGKQLIKNEWDLIETWLVKHVKDTDQ